MRVVNDVSGAPIKPSEIEVGQLINAEPFALFEEDEEGHRIIHGTEALQAKSKAAVIMVRMRPQDITPGEGRENWGIDGILCYSKICTHVGCPISLWEQQTHNVLCPCHQSTFDLVRRRQGRLRSRGPSAPSASARRRLRGLPDRDERLPGGHRAELSGAGTRPEEVG